MTLHIHYDHKCPKCGTGYVPYGEHVPCPKCGLVEVERFEFLGPAADSALVNFTERGAFMPGAWCVGDAADNLLMHVFHALDFHRAAKDIAFAEAARTFFDKMDFGEMEFMRPYLIRLSIDVFEKIDQMKGKEWESRIAKERLAARIHVRTDNERRSLPGSEAKRRLRESRPKNGVRHQADGLWLAYMLDDGRQVLYHDGDGSYILEAEDGGRVAFRNVGELVSYLNREPPPGPRVHSR
jgi:hypothetical protein